MKSKNPEITNLLDRKKRAVSKTRKEELESIMREIERRKSERPILHLVKKREYKKPELIDYSIKGLSERYGITEEGLNDYLFKNDFSNFENLKPLK